MSDVKRLQWCDIHEDQMTCGPLADEWFVEAKHYDAAMADAERYRYMKRICEGLKGVISVSHVVGDKNVLIMGVATDYADEFIDNARSLNRSKP